MGKREVLATPYGEMLDMIACLSIYEGIAVPKDKRKKTRFTTFDEAIRLR